MNFDTLSRKLAPAGPLPNEEPHCWAELTIHMVSLLSLPFVRSSLGEEPRCRAEPALRLVPQVPLLHLTLFGFLPSEELGYQTTNHKGLRAP